MNFKEPWIPPPGRSARNSTKDSSWGTRQSRPKPIRSISECSLDRPRSFVDSVVTYRTDDDCGTVYYMNYPDFQNRNVGRKERKKNLDLEMLVVAGDAEKMKVQLQKFQKDLMVQCQKNDALSSINSQLQKELTHRDQQLHYIQSHSKQLEDKLVKQTGDLNLMEQKFMEWTRRKEDEINRKFGAYRYRNDRREFASDIGDGITKKSFHEDMKVSVKDQTLESIDVKFELSRIAEYKKETDHYKQLYKETQGRLESYREKFHNAQQLVNEQKIQMASLMEEQARLQEEAAREVEKFKNRLQMNGQLSELSPLREVLRVAMMKLQEAHEHKQHLETKLQESESCQIDWDTKLKATEVALSELTNTNQVSEERVKELSRLNSEYQNEIHQREIFIRQQNEKLEDKMREIICLTRQLDLLRENKRSEDNRSLEYYQQQEKNHVRKIQELEDIVIQMKTENAMLKGRQDEKEKAASSREKDLREQVDYLQNTNDVLQNYLQLLKKSYTSVFNCTPAKTTYESLMTELEALTSSVSSTSSSGPHFKRLK